MTAPEFKVFLHVAYVRVRHPGISDLVRGGYRFRAEWIVRGISSRAYASKVCATQEEAVKLARAWLAKHADRYEDTTKYEVAS